MNKWVGAFGFVLILFVIATIFASLFLDSKIISQDSIVILPLHGVITTDGDGSSFIKGESGISSTETSKKIKELKEDDLVKGVIFDIDSPGGAVVPSQEIADAIKDLDKPKYAVIRSAGASGGYWIASATDKIFASELSITGSIGVIGSYLEFSELFEKYGIDYERFVSGKYKDMGSPYKDLSDEERNLMQKKINLIHEYFVKEVAENRRMDIDKIKKLATGEFYLGLEAKELGLIDEFGDKTKAVDEMKKQLNVTDINIVEEKREISLFELLGSLGAYHFGRGFAAELVKFDIENKNY